jgi:hypothetical protein
MVSVGLALLLLGIQLSSNRVLASTEQTASLHTTEDNNNATPPKFRVRVTRSGRRYQIGKRYWGFSGDDAVVAEDIDDAAWFSFDSESQHLKCNDKFVNLEKGPGYSLLGLSTKNPSEGSAISIDDIGVLSLTGDDFKVGKGHGIMCASGDGNIFVVESRRPPFRCDNIGLKSHGKSKTQPFCFPLLFLDMMILTRYPEPVHPSRTRKPDSSALRLQARNLEEEEQLATRTIDEDLVPDAVEVARRDISAFVEVNADAPVGSTLDTVSNLVSGLGR